MQINKLVIPTTIPLLTSSIKNTLKDSTTFIGETFDRSIFHPGWSNQAAQSNLIQAPLEIIQNNVNNAFAAYCKPDQIKEWKCKSCLATPNMKFHGFYSNGFFDSQAYIAINDQTKEFIVAFRGTESFVDDVHDIDILLVKTEIVPERGALVHAGFLMTMDSVTKILLKDLKELLDKDEYKDYKITFVGHSLGGAMATLGLLRVQKELNLPYSRLQLFTYGQPRTGNYRFANWFNALPIVVARVVNKNDPIPAVPPYEIMNYSHIGNEIYIENDGTTKVCNSSVLEDKECSYSVPRYKLNLFDHFLYFNAHSGKQAC